MKKLLFSFLTPLLVSLFFFIPQVKADTINVSIPSENFNYNANNNYTILKNYIDNYMANNSNALYYVIYYEGNDDPNIDVLYAKIYSSLPIHNFSMRDYYGDRINISSNTSPITTFIKRSSDNNVSIGNTNPFYNLNYYNRNGLLDYGLIDANFDFNISNTPNWTETWNINNDSYIITSSGKLPLLINLSPLPTDNTPVLTAFYTLVIDKLSVIADFFTDNIYLFAIPLIPIFILCIYLIKRSLIK